MRAEELILVKKTYIPDSIGNEIEATIERVVFCDVKSISRTEFYQAAQANLKPRAAFIIYSFEYENEKTVIYNDEKYNIIKSYRINENDLELTCEKVIGNE